MKVGDYVRTIDGYIAKITGITEEKEDLTGNKYKRIDVDTLGIYLFNDRLDEFKSSPNIIDLIEVGDFVNGEKVCAIGENSGDIYIRDLQEFILAKDIKSIVTKEQF